MLAISSKGGSACLQEGWVEPNAVRQSRHNILKLARQQTIDPFSCLCATLPQPAAVTRMAAVLPRQCGYATETVRLTKQCADLERLVDQETVRQAGQQAVRQAGSTHAVRMVGPETVSGLPESHGLRCFHVQSYCSRASKMREHAALLMS